VFLYIFTIGAAVAVVYLAATTLRTFSDLGPPFGF